MTIRNHRHTRTRLYIFSMESSIKVIRELNIFKYKVYLIMDDVCGKNIIPKSMAS